VRRAADLLGAPVPDHLLELLRRGRAADGHQAGAALGWTPEHSTTDVVKAVFEWAPVTPLRLVDETAA
jgi:hypothetical protein